MGRAAATTTLPELFGWLRAHTDLEEH